MLNVRGSIVVPPPDAHDVARECWPHRVELARDVCHKIERGQRPAGSRRPWVHAPRLPGLGMRPPAERGATIFQRPASAVLVSPSEGVNVGVGLLMFSTDLVDYALGGRAPPTSRCGALARFGGLDDD